MRTVTWIALCLTLAACAGRVASGPPLGVTGRQCGGDRVAEQFVPWNEVAASGFTFCVPSTWKAIDAQGRRWRASHIEFSWSDRPPHADRKFPFRIGGPDRLDQPISEAHPDTKLILSEIIDGQTVRLTLEHPAGRYTYAATELLEPVLNVNGVARTSEGVADVVAAYRSIRFVRQPDRRTP
jgi:hypothetical protein